jgi:hypothetical protein
LIIPKYGIIWKLKFVYLKPLRIYNQVNLLYIKKVTENKHFCAVNASIEIKNQFNLDIPPKEILKQMYKYWNIDLFEVFYILILKES